MAGNPSLVIFLNVSLRKNPCCFLLGHEVLVKERNRTLFIDAILPITDESKSTSKYSARNININYANGNRSDGNKFILGLVLEDTWVSNVKLNTILNDIFRTSSFYFMVLPNNGIFRKSLLVLPMHITSMPGTPLESHDIGDAICKEIIVVSLEKITKVPILSLPRWNDLFWKRESKENIPEVLHLYLNGLIGLLKGNCPKSPIPKLLYLLLLSLVWLTNWIVNCDYTLKIHTFLSYTGNFLYVTKQLLHRLNQLSEIITSVKEDYTTDCISSRSTCCYNKTIPIIVDIILGLFVVFFILESHDSVFISTWLVGQKYSVAEYLKNLLKWLMGVPAGLKLNRPLNQFLGHFYIYHVHLWTSYLFFIEAYLPSIIWICSLSGCFGITFLLAVVCDVLSLLTIHIHCFYIYAARLYSVEIYVLRSLLRLFTGKKGNILRNRVDSVEYDVDRLFIGTLLFTILLFLFPTIFLYYIVFTTLRLFVLMIQAIIFGVVALFNNFPFWEIWLYFMNPECLPGETIVDADTIGTIERLPEVPGRKLTVHAVQPNSTLFLLPRYQCFPLSFLFKNCYKALVEATYYDMFGGKIFRKLFTGELYDVVYTYVVCTTYVGSSEGVE